MRPALGEDCSSMVFAVASASAGALISCSCATSASCSCCSFCQLPPSRHLLAACASAVLVSPPVYATAVPSMRLRLNHMLLSLPADVMPVASPLCSSYAISLRHSIYQIAAVLQHWLCFQPLPEQCKWPVPAVVSALGQHSQARHCSCGPDCSPVSVQWSSSFGYQLQFHLQFPACQCTLVCRAASGWLAVDASAQQCVSQAGQSGQRAAAAAVCKVFALQPRQHCAVHCTEGQPGFPCQL